MVKGIKCCISASKLSVTQEVRQCERNRNTLKEDRKEKMDGEQSIVQNFYHLNLSFVLVCIIMLSSRLTKLRKGLVAFSTQGCLVIDQ